MWSSDLDPGDPYRYPAREARYPESDGEPVAETWLHFLALMDLLQALLMHFADDPTVNVGGNQFWYYQEGDPKQCFAPDAYVVFGTDKAPRRTWKTWEERCVPGVIVEITSAATRHVDLGAKRGLYEDLGVSEYFLFDPLGDYLKPRLQGNVLREGRYVALVPREDGAIWSERLGVWLRALEARVTVIRADGREYGHLEEHDARNALLYAQLQNARAEAEEARVEAEEARVEAEEARVEAEKARAAAESAAEELRRRVAELEARLRGS